MTAIALLDALSGPPASAAAARGDGERASLSRFVAELIERSLESLDRLRQYERQYVFLPHVDRSRLAEARRSVWQLYSEWTDEADCLRSRATALAAGGVAVPALDRLEQAIGRTRAMLSVPPDQAVRAIEDALDGRGRPAKELRDELHARLRA